MRKSSASHRRETHLVHYTEDGFSESIETTKQEAPQEIGILAALVRCYNMCIIFDRFLSGSEVLSNKQESKELQ